MKNASNASKAKRKGWLAAVGIVAVAILVVAIATAISASQLAKLDDGTENFTGVKQQAAQHALVHVENQYRSEERFKNLLGMLPQDKLQVVKVEPGPGYCGSRYPRKPSDIGYYDVTIRHISLFGIKNDTLWRGCVLESDL